MFCIEAGRASRLGTTGAYEGSGTAGRGASTGIRIEASSVILGWRPAAGLESDLTPFSAGCASASSAAGAFLFLCMGGAFGSFGFRGRRCLGGSLPSGATLALTVLPGLRPGFFLGRPAAVKGTSGGGGGCCICCMMPNRGAEPGSTIISSISMLALPALRKRVGDPGSDSAEGGEDSDVGEEL